MDVNPDFFMLLSNQTFTHVDLFLRTQWNFLTLTMFFLMHWITLLLLIITFLSFFAKFCCEKGVFYPNIFLFFVWFLFLFFYFVHDSSTELMGAHKIEEDAGTKSEN